MAIPPPPPLIPKDRAERAKSAAWRENHARLLRANLALYASEVLRGPPEYGGRFLLGPHHLEWAQAVNKEPRILALAARDHGKSFFWSLAYPLWMVDRKAPGRLGYLFSATDRQAQETLAKIRQEIEGGGENGGPNPKLAHLLPFRTGTTGKTLKFANGSEIRARGFGSRVRGGHPFWVVADDVGNDEWIWSETVRQKAIDYFLSAIRPMVVPGGQLIVVGTPFHAQDLYKQLEDSTVYYVMRHAARRPDGSALWPARYPLSHLERTRKELGSALRFSREYLCVDRNTLIRTEAGYVPIADVAVGQRVLTHTGDWRPVLNVWENPRNDRKMLRVVTSHCAGHVVTADHKLLVVRATDYQRRQRDFSREAWEEAQALLTRGRWDSLYLKVPVVPLPESETISDDLAMLSGWYVAEGHVSKPNQAVYFSLSPDDPVAEIDAACQREFGTGLKLYPSADRGSCAQYVVHSKIAKTWFMQFGMGAENKTLAPIMGMTRAVKLRAVRAYMAGDAHYNALSWRASSVSSRLISDLSDVLLSLGIGCSVQTPLSGGEAVIEGRTVQVLPTHRLDVGGENLSMLAVDGVNRRRSRTFVHAGFLYSRVREVVPIDDYTDDVVYDLHVEGDHSYVGLHGVFHNCQPITDEASLFPTYLFDNPGVKQPYALGLPHGHWANMGVSIYAGVDLAISASAGADYFCMFVMAVDAQGNRWVVDIVRRKGLGYQEQVDTIVQVSKKYHCGLVFCEANQYQRVITDMIVRTSDVPIRAFYTTGRRSKAATAMRRGMKQQYNANKNALDQGVPALRMLLENGKIRVPWAPETRDQVNVWIGEMQAFGWAQGKLQGVGSHDDTVMAMWIADWACQIGGMYSLTDEDAPGAEVQGDDAAGMGDPFGTGDGDGAGLPALGVPIPAEAAWMW